MTDREAIGILSNYYAYCNLTSQVKQAQLVALKALQEREERARGCECGSYFITQDGWCFDYYASDGGYSCWKCYKKGEDK